MVEKIRVIIIDLYLLVFSELGVDMDLFIQKMIEMKENIEEYVKKTLELVSLTNKRVV